MAVLCSSSHLLDKKGEEENKKKRRERDREKVKKTTEKLKKNHKTKEIHRTNCHTMVRQKKTRGTELFGSFSSKVQNLTVFQINWKIRNRFSGSPELISKAFFGRTVIIQGHAKRRRFVNLPRREAEARGDANSVKKERRRKSNQEEIKAETAEHESISDTDL